MLVGALLLYLAWMLARLRFTSVRSRRELTDALSSI